MKKKYLTGILISGIIVILTITTICYYHINTNTNTNKTEEKPYTVSKTIAEIDKANYDTTYWWHATNSQLLEKLSSEATKYNDSQIQSIVNNSKEIPEELIRMAVMRPETIPYVAGYPTRKINEPINIESYYKKGEIPLFEQFDKQWGYDSYGDESLAISGCGPTSLAMVAIGLTGNTQINPRVVANYSEKHGGYIKNKGSSWGLMDKLSTHFGVKGTIISSNQVIKSLKEGHPVIVSEGPGIFTLSGHFIILSGITSDGKIKVNDPDSIKYSNKTWDFKDIEKSANAFWSFSKIN